MSAVLERPTVSAPEAPARRRRWSWPVVGVLAVFGVLIAVQAWNMTAYPINFEDEGTYVAQAWAVLDGRLAHYTYWYDHPPGGWFGIAAWFWLTGALGRAVTAVMAGREFMLVMYVALLTGVYVVSRRLGVRRGWALFAVAVLGLSPLATYYHRIVLLDNVSTAATIGAFALALNPKKRLWVYGGAGALFGYAVYSKLTVGILLPFLVWELWRSTEHTIRPYALAVAGGLFGMVVGMYPLMAVLRGELLPSEDHVSIIQATQFQLLERIPTGSVLDSTSISAGIVENWLSLDIWLPMIGVAAGVAGLFVRATRPYAAALVLQSVVFFRNGYLPFAYIIQLLPFAVICLAGVTDALWTQLRKRQRAGIRTVAVKLAAVIGLSLFVVPIGYGAATDWPRTIGMQLTWDADKVYRDAVAWAGENLPMDARLMVESPLWADLVLQGRSPEDVIWFSKLGGLDPEVTADNPNGWRDFDYIMTRAEPLAMEEGVFFLPEVPPAMENSEVVAEFTNPDSLCGQIYGPSCDVEIRKIDASIDNVPMPGAPSDEVVPDVPTVPIPGQPGAPDSDSEPLPLPEHLAVENWEPRVGPNERHYLVHVEDDSWWTAFGPGQLRGVFAIYGDPVETDLTFDELQRRGLLHGAVLDLFGGPNGIERYYEE